MTMMPWLQNPNAKQQNILGDAAGKIAAKEATKLAGTAIGGPIGGYAGELAGPLASQLVSGLFKDGGKAKKKQSIWSQLADKVSGDFNKRSSLFGGKKQQMPKYRAVGGMTPGPLGMSDMIIAGKGKDVSAVKIKKAMGDMSEEVELNYHPPLAPKPKGE